MEILEGIEKGRTGWWGNELGMFFLSLAMNLWVYPLLVAATLGFIALFPAGFLVLKIFTPWTHGRIMRWLIWCYGRVWITINAPFVKFSREGFQGKKIPTPSILVVNHLSFFDIYCMALLPFFDAVFAVRDWPFKIPWYAPFMHLAEYLKMERIGWDGTLQAAQKIFAPKGLLLFFPEGHRSRNGGLKRFYSGPFKLAVETGVPIVPLCLTGTDILLPPGKWWMRPAKIRLAMLPPVDPTAFQGPLAHLELKRKVKGLIAQKLAETKRP